MKYTIKLFIYTAITIATLQICASLDLLQFNNDLTTLAEQNIVVTTPTVPLQQTSLEEEKAEQELLKKLRTQSKKNVYNLISISELTKSSLIPKTKGGIGYLFLYVDEAMYNNRKHPECAITTGKYSGIPVSEKNWMTMKQDPKYLKTAIHSYKIHLMPKLEDTPFILYKLIKTIKSDSDLKNLICHFKIYIGHVDINSIYMPIIVIYPPKGKANAQALLNKICALFHGTEGLDQAPRFNQKINSLIYYAQGDSDNKIGGSLGDHSFAKDYEPGNVDAGTGMVHFVIDADQKPVDPHIYYLDIPKGCAT